MFIIGYIWNVAQVNNLNKCYLYFSANEWLYMKGACMFIQCHASKMDNVPHRKN